MHEKWLKLKISTVLYVPSPYPAPGKMVFPQHWRPTSDGVSPSPFSRGEFSARQIPLTLPVFFLEGKFCKPNNQHTMCEVYFSSNSLFWQFTPRHSCNELYSHEQTSKISCFFQWYSYPILSFYLSPIVIRYSIKLSA